MCNVASCLGHTGLRQKDYFSKKGANSEGREGILEADLFGVRIRVAGNNNDLISSLRTKGREDRRQSYWVNSDKEGGRCWGRLTGEFRYQGPRKLLSPRNR